MGGLLRPVGGRAPVVYWRRRILVLSVLILVGAVVLGWPKNERGQSSQATATPAVARGSVDRVVACSASDLTLGLDVPTPVVAGTETPLTVRVSNGGDAPCSFEPSSAPLAVSVRSGSDGIWSTADCPDWGAMGMVTIDSGGSNQWEVMWPTSRSQQGCRLSDATLRSGTYIATASVPDVPPARFIFRLQDSTSTGP